MTPAEFKLELGRDVQLLTTEEMVNVFGSAGRKDFPKINRMRTKLIFESAIIIAFTTAASVMIALRSGSQFAIVLFVSLSALFVAAEILGFGYYWRAPTGMNVKEMLESALSKFNEIETAMKALNYTLTFMLILIIFIDTGYTNLIPNNAMFMMIAVKIMTWLFSLKWTARKKNLQQVLQGFEE